MQTAVDSGIQWLRDLCNDAVKGGSIPDDRQQFTSWPTFVNYHSTLPAENEPLVTKLAPDKHDVINIATIHWSQLVKQVLLRKSTKCLQVRQPSCHPTNSVKSTKGISHLKCSFKHKRKWYFCFSVIDESLSHFLFSGALKYHGLLATSAYITKAVMALYSYQHVSKEWASSL